VSEASARVRVAAKAASDAALTAAKAHENAAAAATSAAAAAANARILAMKLAELVGPESPSSPPFMKIMGLSMLNLRKVHSSQNAFEAALQEHPAGEVIALFQEVMATSWHAIAEGFDEIKLGEAAETARINAENNIISFHKVLTAALRPLGNARQTVNGLPQLQKVFREYVTSRYEVSRASTRAREVHSELLKGRSGAHMVSTALAALLQPELAIYIERGHPLIDGVNFQTAISSLAEAATSAYDVALIHKKAELAAADAAYNIAREFLITATCYK
jgi:hypothetical protein